MQEAQCRKTGATQRRPVDHSGKYHRCHTGCNRLCGSGLIQDSPSLNFKHVSDEPEIRNKCEDTVWKSLHYTTCLKYQNFPVSKDSYDIFFF